MLTLTSSVDGRYQLSDNGRRYAVSVISNHNGLSHLGVGRDLFRVDMAIYDDADARTARGTRRNVPDWIVKGGTLFIAGALGWLIVSVYLPQNAKIRPLSDLDEALGSSRLLVHTSFSWNRADDLADFEAWLGGEPLRSDTEFWTQSIPEFGLVVRA